MASLSTEGKNKSADKFKDALYGSNSNARILVCNATAVSDISGEQIDTTDGSVVDWGNCTFSVSGDDVNLVGDEVLTIGLGDNVGFYFITEPTSGNMFVVSQVTETATSYTYGGTFVVEDLQITIG